MGALLRGYGMVCARGGEIIPLVLRGIALRRFGLGVMSSGGNPSPFHMHRYDVRKRAPPPFSIKGLFNPIE